jgi:hypothetical protein
MLYYISLHVVCGESCSISFVRYLETDFVFSIGTHYLVPLVVESKVVSLRYIEACEDDCESVEVSLESTKCYHDNDHKFVGLRAELENEGQWEFVEGVWGDEFIT